MPPRSDRPGADDGRLIELGRASIAALVLSAACGGTAADDPGPSLLKEDTELLASASAKLSDLGLECTLFGRLRSGVQLRGSVCGAARAITGFAGSRHQVEQRDALGTA